MNELTHSYQQEKEATYSELIELAAENIYKGQHNRAVQQLRLARELVKDSHVGTLTLDALINRSQRL